MPWNTQGGGPWGGGGPGPWGGRRAAGSSRPTWRSCCGAARSGQEPAARAWAARIGGRRWDRLLAVAAVALWLASAASIASSRRSRASCCASASSTARPSPACNYHLPAPIEAVIRPQVDPRQPGRGRLPLRLGPAGHAGHARARRHRRGADADRRREHHRRQLRRAVEDRRRRAVPVRHPRSRGHREGRRRERGARDHRPDPDCRGHDRGPADDRDRRRASSCSSS